MDQLKHLGKQSSEPTSKLDLIEWKGAPLRVALNCSEFTSHCPVTNQPDFGHLVIEYIPGAYIAETKSVKLYLWRFRDLAAFNESIADEIADDFYTQLNPSFVRVTLRMNARGGIAVTATATRGSERDTLGLDIKQVPQEPSGAADVDEAGERTA
jgi:7-cyano-7-deazaguanine reductase